MNRTVWIFALLLWFGGRSGAETDEEKLAREQAADEAHAKEVAALRADPAIMRVALSARICLSQESLEAASSEAKKRSAAAVHDREREAKLQAWVKQDTATIKTAQAELKKRKLRPSDCKESLVRDVGRCLRDDNPRACHDPIGKYALALSTD